MPQIPQNATSENPQNAAMRWAMAAIAVIAWIAVGGQFYLEVQRSLAGAGPMGTILLRFFSFFTILTNILVAWTLTTALLGTKSAWGQFFSRATVQAGVAVYIAVVGAIYSLLLRHLWNPVGPLKWINILLHDVVPVAYILYWLILVPKATLRWKHALLWLTYPLAYMVYTLIRGAISGWYPYPFIDATVIGYPRALGNGGLLLLLFFVLGLIVVAICRSTGRTPLQIQ